MSKVKKAACETCGRGVQLSGQLTQSSRVYWCPACSVDATLALQVRLCNGQLQLGVFRTDGQPPIFHPLDRLPRVKTATVRN